MSRDYLQPGAMGTRGARTIGPNHSRRAAPLAKHYLRRERPGHTLQISTLDNEAYVRLINWKTAHFEGRAHSFESPPQLMRRILVDFARQGAASAR